MAALTQAQLKNVPRGEMEAGLAKLSEKFRAIKKEKKEQLDAFVVNEKRREQLQWGIDLVGSGIGGAAAGYWIGSNQRDIDAGVEGTSEEDLQLGGLVDKDLALGLGLGLAAVLTMNVTVYKPAVGEGGRTPTAEEQELIDRASISLGDALKGTALGALAFWAGRKAHKMAMEAEVEESEA